MKYEEATPDQEKSSDKIDTSGGVRPQLTNVQRGIIKLGVVAGAVYAIHTKRGFWGILGFMWLGSVAGGGLGYLLKNKQK